jgi:hypothetical protein
MAQFGAKAVIPLEDVRREYFPHLDTDRFQRKLVSGEIPLPVFRAEKSAKSAKGIYIQDLADFMDEQRAAALKEHDHLCELRSGGVRIRQIPHSIDEFVIIERK